MDYRAIEDHVKEIAIVAGEKILDIYHHSDFEIEKKDDSSPLTKADRVANDYIVEQLKRAYPEFGLLSEESKSTNERLTKKHVWVVDPLDGTKEFIKRNGEFTVNIGLVENGTPVVGVISIPVSGESYFASKGNGSYRQDQSGNRVKNQSSMRSGFSEMVLVKSRSHGSEKLQNLITKYAFAEIVEKGSSLKVCLIAEGKADVYFRFGLTNEWDICAAQCVLIEAGGEMTDCYGNELHYNKQDTLNKNGFIASNKIAHVKFVEIAKEFFES